MSIRRELPADSDKIANIYTKGFDTDAEAKLVNALRESGAPYISLVYEEGNDLIGHILFTLVALEGDDSGARIMGLAPICVLPGDQCRGIGSSLVRAGLDECKSEGYEAVVVLGYTGFYPKFGFVSSVEFGITTTFNVPVEVFMAQELKPGALKDRSGQVKFNQAFDQFKR